MYGLRCWPNNFESISSGYFFYKISLTCFRECGRIPTTIQYHVPRAFKEIHLTNTHWDRLWCVMENSRYWVLFHFLVSIHENKN